MANPFRISQGDISFHGNFAEPAFAALSNPTPLVALLYSALNRFGLRLTDMKFDRANGNVGEAHLHCSLLNYSTNIRVLADRVEVLCFDSLRLTQEQFVDGARSTLEAVSQTIPNKSYKSYALTVNLHGSVEGVTTREYLTKIVGTGPKDFGPLLASGAVFYYGAEAERLTSFLSIDLSGVLTGALYVRSYVVWDATKVTLVDLPAIAEKFIRAAFESLDLQWPALLAK